MSGFRGVILIVQMRRKNLYFNLVFRYRELTRFWIAFPSFLMSLGFVCPISVSGSCSCPFSRPCLPLPDSFQLRFFSCRRGLQPHTHI